MRRPIKLMLMLLLILGLSVFVVACGSDESSNAKNENGNNTGEDNGNKGDATNGDMPEVTLNVTTTFGGDDPGRDVYEDLLNDFTDQHPNVTINRDDFTASSESKTKFETAWNGGTVPDLFFYFVDSQVNYIYDSDEVVPMEEIMDENSDWAETLNEAALNGVKTLAPTGELLAIPLVGYYEGLIVNKKLFEDNDIELPTDWDKFETAIEKFQEKDIIPLTASMNEPNYLIEHFILGSGGAECHGKGLKDGVPDCYVDGLNLIKQTYEAGAYPEDTLTLKDDEAAQQYYQNGEAAMLLDGSWAVGGIPDEIADNSTVLAMPTPPGASGYDGNQVISGFSSGWYVSKDAYNSDKKEVVTEFLKFMTSVDADTDFANAFGSVPSINGVEVDAANDVSADGFDLAQNASALEPASDGFIPSKVFNHIRDNIPSVVEGKISAEDLLKEAQGKALD